MTAMSVVVPGVRGEVAKVAAFVRRDLLMAVSYRTAFIADGLSLVGQALVFAFVGRLVDPTALPSVGGRTIDYLSFVTIGIAVTGFLQVGLSRLTGVIASERLMGTLEAVLLTPTRWPTLQVGWVAFDMLYVPLRTLLYLALLATGFGVPMRWAGAPVAVAYILAFLPFVWGVGVFAAAAALLFRRAAAFSGAIAFALTFTSGAYFPLSVLPAWAASVAALNPLAVAVDGTRAALLGGPVGWGVAVDLSLLLAVGCAVLTAGSVVFARALGRELRSGAIGTY